MLPSILQEFYQFVRSVFTLRGRGELHERKRRAGSLLLGGTGPCSSRHDSTSRRPPTVRSVVCIGGGKEVRDDMRNGTPKVGPNSSTDPNLRVIENHQSGHCFIPAKSTKYLLLKQIFGRKINPF